MTAYFDIIKLVFFILTVFVALFQLRLRGILSHSIVDIIWPFVLPVYFIFVWLIIWYIIWYILSAKNWPDNEEKSYIKWFVIWGIIGIIISAVYYFMMW